MKIYIFTFHGIGRPERELEPGEEEVWLEVDSFKSILDLLSQKENVRITFDDGNSSDLIVALPLLKERGLKGDVFVPIANLGKQGFLSASDVNNLREGGMRIGSHGMNHRPWRGLDDESLQVETAGAKEALESILREPVHSAACPFGSYDRRVIEKLKAVGFCEVFTSDGGVTTLGQFPMSRTTIQNDDTPESIEKTLSIPHYHPKALAQRFKRCLKQWR